MKPVPSRTVRKWILPLERRLCSQPLSVTVWPSCLAMSSMYAVMSSASARSNRCRAPSAPPRAPPPGVPVLASSIRYVPVVADLLHRRSAPRPSRSCRRTAPGDRRRCPRLSCTCVVIRCSDDGLDRVDHVAHQVRVAEVEADAGARARRARARAASPATPASDSSFGITSTATRTPSGSASAADLLDAAERRRAVVVAGGLLRRRRAQVHDQHVERNPPRDAAAPLGLAHRRLPRRRGR